MRLTLNQNEQETLQKLIDKKRNASKEATKKRIKFSKSWERLEYSVDLVINRYNRQLL